MTIYEIRIKGHLDRHWSEWLAGLAISYDREDNTILSGPLVDQATLHGVLIKIRDLGVPLLAVNCIEPRGEDKIKPYKENKPT